MQIFVPFKGSILQILYNKSNLSDQILRRWMCHSLNFSYMCCNICGYKRKVVLMLQKFSCKNIFTIEMFIFANSVQKVDFEQSHFQKVGVALAEIYSFELFLLRVLEESCFKSPKIPLDECFYHRNVHFR